MARAHRMPPGEQYYIQGFGRETRIKETTRKTSM
jgi:hypothetical protein